MGKLVDVDICINAVVQANIIVFISIGIWAGVGIQVGIRVWGSKLEMEAIDVSTAVMLNTKF
jgi:hypothetical protein